ncbi:conserved protein of unknown function [Candidatus Hydrogenisulfobacillus filiaventi]|uniref:Glycosyltransferase 2-like domain-containing protein n=1 Tax=Candidatus Hydrogenisulfobacillus filiaventi TaxID=2707344 RepID=A0A6F8ZCT6_9FIRM|nr:conserved protein of unknown function [Candidatus Hydrogenisulfobacillus filiaventi]
MASTDSMKDLLLARDYRRAVDEGRALLAEDPRNAQAWVFLGEGLEQLGQKRAAWACYNRGWMLDPAAGWVEAAKARLFPLAMGPLPGWLEELLAVPRVTVAAALIVHNEEKTLSKVLEAVKPAVDDIVVVDTGSQDATVEIAKAAGARVFSVEWQDDFSAARNAALAQVTSDWVLWVDGDEVLDSEDVEVPRTVAGLFDGLPEPVIMRIVQVNRLGNRWEPNYDMSRLHPARFGIRWWGRIHEQLGPPEGGVYAKSYPRPVVRIRLIHEGYQPEVMKAKGKLERNVRLLEKSVQDDPNDVASWGFLGRERYFLGQLDEAIDALYRAEQLAAQNPSYGRVAEVRQFLTEALLARDRVDEALAVAERAVAESANFPAAWYLLGKARLTKALALLRGAKEAFGKSLETAPTYRGIVSFDSDIARWKAPAAIADVLKLSGDWVGARAGYERVLSTAPELEIVRKQLEQMDRQIAALAHNVAITKAKG